MNRTIAAVVTLLIGAVLASGCGGSSAAHPTHAQLLAGFGDVLGSSGAVASSPRATPHDLIVAMGDSWVHQVCQEKTDAALEGMTSSRARGYFDKGYRATAPASAPAADVVFRQIAADCARQGL